MKTNKVVFAGDSITTENYVSAGEGYPARAAALLPNEITGYSNTAIGSTSLASDGGQAAAIDALFDVAKTVNVASIFFGANDLLSISGAQYYADYKTYCLARRSAGFLVIAVTVLPHTTGGGIESARATANTSIRGDTSFYDALADFASDSLMGLFATASNPTYYGDGVHPTALGNTLLAPYMSKALFSLITSSAGRNL